MRAITELERERFDMIRTLPTDPAYVQSLAIVSTEFDGEETAAVALIQRDDDGDFTIFPVALLLTDEMFTRLAPPDTDLEG